MKRIRARTLLNFSLEQLWNILIGSFTLIFDDGEEITTDARSTLYSAYAWEFHRLFPKTPLLKSHHLRFILGESGRLGSNTHLQLLGNAMWSTYHAYVDNGHPLVITALKMELAPDGYHKEVLRTFPVNEVEFRDHLAEKIYRTTNLMYNELTYKLEEYVVSLDITDFAEVMEQQDIKKVNYECQSLDLVGLVERDSKNSTTFAKKIMEGAIERAYTTIHTVLSSGTHLPNNRVSLAYRSNLVSPGQVWQSVGPRGFLTDTDSYQFPFPVMRGYVQGFRELWEALMESRSAAKALLFSKTPLQQAEYFSRRLQLMSQVVTTLHHGDCGTQKYLRWPVRGKRFDEKGRKVSDGDLPLLVGKYYLDKDDKLKVVKASDDHLVGQTIRVRAAVHCAHPDPYGICSTCFGELWLSVPDNTNIGQMCCTFLAQQSSQAVLSVKHLDVNALVKAVQIGSFELNYLRKGADDNSYLLAEKLQGKKVKVIVSAENAANLNDVREEGNIGDLNITRVSEFREIAIRVGEGSEAVLTPLNVSQDGRLASFTYAMLAHLRNVGWEYDAKNNFVIDMTGWDWNKAFLTLPLVHFNMSDHSRNIAAMLESSVEKLKERDKTVTADAALIELTELVNDKINVPVAVLDVVLYSTMVVQLNESSPDYSLPKPWTPSEQGVMKLTMAHRSIAAAMAFEQHRDVLYSPLSYTYTNRPDHPTDGIICPTEVFAYPVQYKSQPKLTI